MKFISEAQEKEENPSTSSGPTTIKCIGNSGMEYSNKGTVVLIRLDIDMLAARNIYLVFFPVGYLFPGKL